MEKIYDQPITVAVDVLRHPATSALAFAGMLLVIQNIPPRYISDRCRIIPNPTYSFPMALLPILFMFANFERSTVKKETRERITELWNKISEKFITTTGNILGHPATIAISVFTGASILHALSQEDISCDLSSTFNPVYSHQYVIGLAMILIIMGAVNMARMGMRGSLHGCKIDQ